MVIEADHKYRITLAAITSNRAMQGVLLTVMGIFAFVVAMVLLPKAQVKFKEQTVVGSE